MNSHNHNPRHLPQHRQQQRLDLKRKRVSKACGPCKQRKVKCSADLPCKHCSETGDFCYYPQSLETPASASAAEDGGAVSQEVLDRLLRLEQTFESIGVRLYNGETAASATVGVGQGEQQQQQQLLLPQSVNRHQDALQSSKNAKSNAPVDTLRSNGELLKSHSSFTHPYTASDSPAQLPADLGLQDLENATSLDLQQHREDRKGSLRFLGPGCTSSLQAELSIAQSADRDTYVSSKRAPAPHGIFWTPETGLEAILAQIPAEALPPDTFIDELLGRYWTTYFPIMPIVDKETVARLTLVIRTTRNPHADPRGAGILYIMMACALRINSLSTSTYESINSSKLLKTPENAGTPAELDSYTCFQRAHRYFLMSGEQATIVDVQFQGLCSFYHVCVNAAARAWVLTGSALRLAIDLGMHVSSRSFKSSIRQERRRAFWSLYSIENLLASNLGRPASLLENEITQEYPVEPSDAASDGGLAGFLHILRVQRLIAVSRKSILEYQHSSGDRTQQLRNQVTGYLRDLQVWYQELPTHLAREYHLLSRPERCLKLIMDELHRSTCLMLSLPFLPQRAVPSTQHDLLALSRCMTAAREIIKSAAAITIEVPASHYLFSATQYLNAAGALFLLHYYQGQGDSQIASDAIQDVDNCIKALEDRQIVYFGAQAALGFLANMYEKVMASKVAKKSLRGYDGNFTNISHNDLLSMVAEGTAAPRTDGAILGNQAAHDSFFSVPHSPLFVSETYDPASVESATLTKGHDALQENDWSLPEVLVPFGRTFDSVNLDFQGLEELFTGQSMQFDSMAQWPLFGDMPNE